MQIPLSKWPTGLWREIATIDSHIVVEHLGSRLTFERDHDDLDAFSAAILTIGAVHFALRLYDHIPTGHVILIATENAVGDQASIETFLNWSGVPHSAVMWSRPGGTECPFSPL
jgi:hypothetical protein